MYAPADDASLVPGTALAHYVVRRRVGSGAMGTVYEAHDTALDRTVALKVVNPHLADDAEVAERFTREARAAARANHANLTHIYFVGTAGNRPFYAMEYVPGANLEDRVARTGPLALAEAIDVVVQAAQGLAAAHAVGVVHRDVKPSNLILLPDGTVKVTDFGLAKSLAGDPSATQAGQAMGTPVYMSPEQCRGEGVDLRTDVYALGLTAWFLLTGRPAFGGTSIGAVLNHQMNTPIPPVVEARPELPSDVDGVLKRLCAKDPDGRPKSMSEVVALFESIRPREIVPAPFAARAAALATDLTVFGIVASALAFGVGRLGDRLGFVAHPVSEFGLSILVAAIALLSQWGLEVRYGASLGKRLLGIAVVAESGVAASPRRLLGRFFIRNPGFASLLIPDGMPDPFRIDLALGILQLVAFAVGALVWPFFGRRTLSDRLTRTRVVYREPAAPAEPAARR